MVKKQQQISQNYTPDQGEVKINKRHNKKKEKLVAKKKFKKNKKKFAEIRSAL